jgi:hypothetical protein
METFTSTKNKGFLWNLMVETNVFSGIPENSYDQVKALFEKEMEIVDKMSEITTLTEKNKKVLLQVTKKLNPIRKNIYTKDTFVTSHDISQERQQLLSEQFKLKQKEFKTNHQSEIPAKIEFGDIKETPIGDEMDDMLSNMMARREKELNHVLSSHDTESAKEWIVQKNPLPLGKPAKLIIGEKPSLQKVTFEDEKEINLIDFFDIKKNETKIDKSEVEKEIKIIQKTILDLFQRLNRLLEEV